MERGTIEIEYDNAKAAISGHDATECEGRGSGVATKLAAPA